MSETSKNEADTGHDDDQFEQRKFDGKHDSAGATGQVGKVDDEDACDQDQRNRSESEPMTC